MLVAGCWSSLRGQEQDTALQGRGGRAKREQQIDTGPFVIGARGPCTWLPQSGGTACHTARLVEKIVRPRQTTSSLDSGRHRKPGPCNWALTIFGSNDRGCHKKGLSICQTIWRAKMMLLSYPLPGCFMGITEIQSLNGCLCDMKNQGLLQVQISDRCIHTNTLL